MLEEPGESDLLGKLEQHQLQYKYGGDLGQRSRPATGGRCQSLLAVYHQRDQCCPDRNRQQCDQVPAHPDPPPLTAASEIRDPSPAWQRGRDQEDLEAGAERHEDGIHIGGIAAVANYAARRSA
jgi:hypothetical protein